MIAANYSEFRNELKNYLDNVEFNNETLIIKRGSGKGTVLISLDEYNSIMETLHLLSSKKNAKRLFESIEQMKTGKRARQTEDKKALRKINNLIKEIQRSPHDGIGKPEPLKFDLAGLWSRRIDLEHRLVYKIEGDDLLIYACRYHYDKK